MQSEPKSRVLPRTAFIENRRLGDVKLSPDGKFVAYLRGMEESRSLWLLPTDGGPAKPLLGKTTAERILWSRDGQWLFLNSGSELQSISIRGVAGLRLPLGGVARRSVMQLDPTQNAAVLLREAIAATQGPVWRIRRVDATGKKTRNVFLSRRWVQDLALDSNDNPVAMIQFNGQQSVLYRLTPDHGMRRVLALSPMQRLNILGVRNDGSLYLMGNPASASPAANFMRVLLLDAADQLQDLQADPNLEQDLENVTVDPQTFIPVAATYRSTSAATYGVGDMAASVRQAVGLLGNVGVDLQIGSGKDAPWLLTASGATLRESKWYLYSPTAGQMRRILDDPILQKDAPAATDLTPKIPVRFRASDGQTVFGFLIIPKGIDVRKAPLIAQVHGGPINHFRTGFDGVAQFLANRGYIVFQSNFRGSTGHGLAYTFAPNGDYGNGRVQLDTVEGVQWLLKQGIGDPQRVGIIGHSFGGYSALLGATFQPQLFKAAFAGAPPPDLGWSMRWELQHGYQAAQPGRSMLNTLRALGLDGSNSATFAQLHAQSPLRNYQSLNRPVMIFAGGRDPTVPFRSVTNYVAQLRLAGKNVTLLVDPDGGHSPTDPVSSEAYLFAMESFLQQHLGGGKPQPPGEQLQTFMQKNTR